MPTKSLESLGKFSSFSFMVCGVLDNLPGIRADHMNGKPGWQDWGLAELMQSLEEWKAIYPMKVNESVHRLSPSLLPFLHPHPPHLPHPPRIPHKSSFYTQDHGSIYTCLL